MPRASKIDHMKGTMKTEIEDRTIARIGNVAIGQFAYGFWVAGIGTKGEKSRNPGAEALRQPTYWGSLAAACEAAALRIADESEAKSLQEYARSLRVAVAEIRANVDTLLESVGPRTNDFQAPGRGTDAPPVTEAPKTGNREAGLRTRKRRNG
jgi:hypothetical protein